MFSSFFVVILLVCSIQYAHSYNQVFIISEGLSGNTTGFNSATYTRGNSQVNCTLLATRSSNLRGMWQVYDSETGWTAHAEFFTESDELMGEEDMHPYFYHITEIRPWGSLELTQVALSLYENTIIDYPFGTEYHFTEAEWSGEPFPVQGYAYTGWSNWTLYEEPNFGGKSYCLRASMLYSNGDADSSFPSVVGSVRRDCNSSKIDVEINLPSSSIGSRSTSRSIFI